MHGQRRGEGRRTPSVNDARKWPGGRRQEQQDPRAAGALAPRSLQHRQRRVNRTVTGEPGARSELSTGPYSGRPDGKSLRGLLVPFHLAGS